MTSAARSAFRAGKSEPRKLSSSGSRRAALKAVICIPLTVAAGAAVLTGLMTGLGWGLGLALGGHPDARSLARAIPPLSVTWAEPADGGDGAVQESVAVERFPVAATASGLIRPVFRVAALDPLGGLARVVPVNLPDDRIVTGSLGPSGGRRATYRVASIDSAALDVPTARVMPMPLRRPTGAMTGAMAGAAIPAAMPAARQLETAAAPLPLPRVRPKLASLTPLDGIKTEDDIRGRRTAIYDITAQVVHMPNGEQLEAHSGLGRYMDDPSSARLKMRGVTPPNTYTLKLRESLFHGVQAIRMTPVSEDRMFGRDGILAHTYMLGPSGQSNGCVSFRDYPRFLRAFQRGEVDRIVVVERLPGGLKAPTFADRSAVRDIANIF